MISISCHGNKRDQWRVIYSPNVRDHRWLPVARSVPVERSGTSTEHDTGSHSVHRIVGLIILFLCLMTHGKESKPCSLACSP